MNILSQDSIRGHPPRILIIDDEEIICELFKDVFEDYHVKVDTATSGDIGLEKVRENEFNVIFLDVKIGNQNGVDVLRNIMNMNPASNVIMISGYLTDTTIDQINELGARSYLNKPLMVKDIVSAAEKYLKFEPRKEETPVRVLIADDDEAFLDQLTGYLKAFHYQVIGKASSVGQVVDFALQLKPDLILMDVMMESPLAGINATKAITKSLDVPIVYVSGIDDDDVISQALETNPYGYIPKPIRPEYLKTSIRLALMRHNYEKMMKDYQSALQETESLFHGIVQTMNSGFYRMDMDGNILLTNLKFAQILGLNSPEELEGKSLQGLGLWRQDDWETFMSHIQESRTVIPGEFQWTIPQGHVITILHTGNVRFNGSESVDDVKYIDCNIQDITRMKDLESQLRHSQKLEVIGTLSSRLAHEINNRLTAILGYTDLSISKAKEDHLSRYLESIRQNAITASDSIRQLLNFSRKQRNERKWINLNEEIGNIDDLIRNMVGKNVDVRFNLCNEELTVFADPKLFEQVVFNLVINSKDAMAEGGKLEIQTQLLSNGKHRAVVHIKDTGHGIEEENIEKVFEPFFTTKEESLGTGLGLSIVKSIIRENGGDIFVNSVVGKGTTFTLAFTLANESAKT